MESVIYKGHLFLEPDFENVNTNRYRTLRAIKKGILKKGPCMICNSENAEAHHEKYNDFLNIKWLCRSHHRAVHSIFERSDKKEYNEMRLREAYKNNPKSPLLKMYVDELDAKAKILINEKRS